MTSHELAARLREVAGRIDAHEDSKIGTPSLYMYFDNKEDFVSAAKIFGGRKDATDSYFFYVRSLYGELKVDLAAARSLVCRLVAPKRDAIYECEPLLSQEEEASIGI